ncbi:hypothetical protein KAX97_11890 [candidate division WOR-3 bacterium]|nr:hypothetical protein [candidate division WOR-3 bacterium]
MHTPDRVFIKDLKQLDARLGCYFNETHRHFVITHERAVGPPAEIMLVERGDGGFRQPDKREIDVLCEGDLHRTNVKERLQKTVKYMDQFREKEAAHAKDEIRNTTKDDRRQLMNTYAKAFNTGKGNSTFRRIKPKNGKSFSVIDKRRVS